MLVFGWISDKIGRKTGMMTATGIVALFSALSASSYGAGGSPYGLFAALSAYRYALTRDPPCYHLILPPGAASYLELVLEPSIPVGL
jgi:MFS family permease